MNKRALIVKDAKANIDFRGSHIEVQSMYEQQYIGLEQVHGVYLNQDINLKIKEAILLAKKVPVYFIDKNGTIIAKVSFQV